jgi:DNA-binding transcriptional ArsR family regulator
MEGTRPPLEPELAELVARRFGALAEPTRLRLIDVLRVRGEASVGELSDALDAGDANVSKHLHVLLDQRIVARRREGTRVVYRIADSTVLALCEQVCGTLARELSELAALADTGSPGRAAA